MGPALILTSVVLACGLAVTVFSNLPSLRLFGWLSAFAMIGVNAGCRPTWFSQNLLWDSWIDIDVPSPSDVRHSSGAICRSYSAWPNSCIAARTDSSWPSV